MYILESRGCDVKYIVFGGTEDECRTWLADRGCIPVGCFKTHWISSTDFNGDGNRGVMIFMKMTISHLHSFYSPIEQYI